MYLLSRCTIFIALCNASIVSFAQSRNADGPLPPDHAATSMEVESGLKLELVAAEPMVVAPVALAFDLQGRMFVVENRGYPIGPAPGKPPQGRVALLEDTDSDGRFDKRIEFAEGLSFPNGILPWRDGAIVTCSPDILFLRDTDGDGKADVREVIFTGFGTEGSTQLRASHPTLAPDGWIYVTNGLSGGKVISPKFPEMKPITLGKNTFRFSPDFSKAEAASGPAQFGMSFDDFGRQFVCYNRVQAQLVMLTPHVVARAPNVAISSLLHNCPIDLEAEPLAGHGAAAKIFPISKNITTADSHAGTFTAACGVTLVSGEPQLGYYGGVLSCDPTANLVHFDMFVEQGAAIGVKRKPGNSEFLRSSDSWFRPVFLAFGPDEALYVCDMYRKSIEHPDYLPTEVRKHTDFTSGAEMGRIWRVTNSRVPYLSLLEATSDLRKGRPERVVPHLKLSAPWLRDTAFRLMVQEKKEAFKQPLWSQLVNDVSSKEIARADTLAQLYEIDFDRKLESCLDNKLATVRETALRLLGSRYGGQLKWIVDHAKYAFDPNQRVRFQLAISIGASPAGDEEKDRAICDILAGIASKGRLDKWMRIAILCGITGREAQFLTELKKASYQLPIDRELLREASRLLALRHAKEKQLEVAARILKTFESNFGERAAALGGLMEVWRNQGWLRDKEFQSAMGVGAILDEAVQMMGNADASISDKVAAAEVLSLARTEPAELALFAALDLEPLQIPALRALCSWREAAVADRLLAAEKWGSYSTAVREELIATMLTAPETIEPLLKRLESGEISLQAIDSLKRRQLTSHRDESIRARAEKLFGAIQGNRAAVYASLKEVAELPGNSSHGRKVFGRSCANCHRLNQEGFAVGPDLFGIRNQPKATILLHLLVPDQEITQGFNAYTAVLHDGRSLQGLLANETATSVSLRLPQGKEENIPRDQLEEFSKSPLSLMPQGIENTLSRQELADLLAYLKGEAENEPPAIPPTEKAP